MRVRDYTLVRQNGRTCSNAEHGARPPKRAAAGLSKLHNRTGANQKPPSRLTWYEGASLVDIETPLPRHLPSLKQSNKRQRVTEWSASSRSRLKRCLGMLKRESLGKALVVTLTYPAEFPAPDDHAVYKYHLKVITTYIRRRWPNSSGVWKLEFQTRGAAHYHLMMFGLWDVPIEEVRTWIESQWYRIAHNGDKHLGKAGTQVERIKSVGGALNYFAKYLSKGDQTRPGNFTGRYWGKLNPEKLPSAKAHPLELSEKRAFQLRRIARKKMESDVNRGIWRRWLEEKREQWRGVSCLNWQLAKCSYQSRAERIPLWFRIDADSINVDGMIFTAPAYDLLMKYDREHFGFMLPNIRLPRRWKARNNDRVRLLCDASAFVQALARLEKPASSFREFSVGTPARKIC